MMGHWQKGTMDCFRFLSLFKLSKFRLSYRIDTISYSVSVVHQVARICASQIGHVLLNEARQEFSSATRGASVIRCYKPIQGPHSTIRLPNFACSHLSCMTKILTCCAGSIGYRFGEATKPSPLRRNISARLRRYHQTSNL
jgi:hypothetical protein